MQQQKDKKIKIEAPLDDTVELIRSAFGDSLPSTQLEEYPIRPGANVEPVTNDPLKNLPTVSEDVVTNLKNNLMNPPTLEQHKPTKLRRVGAAIAGGLVGATQGADAGFKTSSTIAQKPYQEAYQDWLTRTGALEKQANLELNINKAQTGGLSELASYLRAQMSGDPVLQGEIARAREAGTQSVRAPIESQQEADRQKGRIALEDIRTERAMTLEERRQKGLNERNAANIASREKTALDAINSRENIAEKARELRKQIADRESQRVPPNQQYLARIMAENEISKIISDPDELDNLFTASAPNDQGVITYTLKPKSEIKAAWIEKYNERTKEMENIRKGILGSSYDPNAGEYEIEDETEEFEIEEVQ